MGAASPWECVQRARADAGGVSCFFWEEPGRESIAALGEVHRVEASGPERFAVVRGRIAAVLRGAAHRGAFLAGAPGPAAVGGFAFADEEARNRWSVFPAASFVIPERIWWKAAGGETVETVWWRRDPRTSDDPPVSDLGRGLAPSPNPTRRDAGAAGGSAVWNRSGWTRAVRATLDCIGTGSLAKAVLARSEEISSGEPFDPFRILASLGASHPSCYRFLVSDGRGSSFVGASPERLVRLRNGLVASEAVAGTARRDDREAEAALAAGLLTSGKDRSEHEMVLRHLLENLKPYCAELDAPVEPEVMRLRHLLHLRTPVHGRAREGTHVLDLVAALHPTPAVAGTPRDRAIEWIRSLEPCDRGWYAGPIGWVNARGEGDFAVGIRSLAVCGSRARLHAGAGIVAGSDPDLEWMETKLKMRPIFDALARD